jgi:uncharacterized damage-inducible protein DinB
MNKEMLSIINDLKTVLNGKPWYGTPVYEILSEAAKTNVFHHPQEKYHSQIEILYHMFTWTEFTLSCLQKKDKASIAAIEALDWRTIDPKEATWEKGFAQLKTANVNIIELLENLEDNSLAENVEFRNYNTRFLLNGLIQHHIYHAGQIAYLKNLCD